MIKDLIRVSHCSLHVKFEKSKKPTEVTKVINDIQLALLSEMITLGFNNFIDADERSEKLLSIITLIAFTTQLIAIQNSKGGYDKSYSVWSESREIAKRMFGDLGLNAWEFVNDEMEKGLQLFKML